MSLLFLAQYRDRVPRHSRSDPLPGPINKNCPFGKMKAPKAGAAFSMHDLAGDEHGRSAVFMIGSGFFRRLLPRSSVVRLALVLEGNDIIYFFDIRVCAVMQAKVGCQSIKDKDLFTGL